MHPRDEDAEVQAQIKSIIEELGEHMALHAAMEERDKRRDETLQRIETSVDEMMTRLTEWQGMGKLAKAIFFGVGPIAGLVVWIKEHLKW